MNRLLRSPQSVIPTTNVTQAPPAVTLSLTKGLHATVIDLTGRIVQREQLRLQKGEAALHINAGPCLYILHVADEQGNARREKIEIRKQET